jgi:hypothetical protein
MKRLLGLCAAAVLFGAALGCGGSATTSGSGPKADAPKDTPLDKAEALMKEQLALMGDMAEATAKKNTDKIKELEGKSKELAKKMEGLKLSEEDQKKLEAKYKDEMDKAMKKMTDAMAAGLKDAGLLKDKDAGLIPKDKDKDGKKDDKKDK